MERFDFARKKCYNSPTEMRLYLKYGILGSLSVVLAAGLVLAVTMGVMHWNNSHGQGGLETPGLPDLTKESLSSPSSDFETYDQTATDADFENTTEYSDSEDLSLSYISYRIKKGDMIGYIADEFGVTQDTIISVNNIRQSRLIQPGQYLKIPSMPGILYTVRTGNETITTIAKKYKIEAEKCALLNNLGVEDQLPAGKILFLPGAELDWVTRQEINGDLFKKPIKRSYYTSSKYGWRTSPFDGSKRTFHSGIDMACPTGTKIYAALPGKVTVAGWSPVFGNYVIVSHHSGYQTLYGHMSQILIAKGRYVDTNTVLGLVGSTGMSTGPHLHFTVKKNGRLVNPSNLWL